MEPDEPAWLAWLKGVLTERGYDIKSPRGGGRAKLAKDTGLAGSSVTRIMSGQVPEYETIVLLSRHLDVSLSEFLIRTGRAMEADFHNPGNDSGHVDVLSGKPLTPEELAVAAGVPTGDRDWFVTMVRRLRKPGARDDSAENGGAAAEG
ncbi:MULTISPECIES: hypothetical protein [unclassified Streptomyces]|uniref:hypothetical protein n=1 Tax=unclassified Streptomyces TaxID=2593676 RepID=UPI00344762D0